MQLTERQEEILAFISEYQRNQKVPPSTRIIQKHFGFGSQTTVVRHLDALASKGALEQLADGAWGAKANAIQAVFELPIYGEIPAGTPSAQEQQQLRSVALDPALFGVRPSRHHLLWGLDIKGDSMIGAQIRDGDIGIFERREPRIGEIVAALVNETTVTLKRLVEVGGRKILRAENKKYSDIVPSSGLECQGVLVGVIRNRSP
ncbi:MAG: transcriptional repressor LexA [Opitutaceae bacterium]|jgi:repressor LexA